MNEESPLYKRFYSLVSDKDWNDWRWQIRNRITTATELEKFIKLDNTEKAAIEKGQCFSLTPHYACLLASEGGQSLRRAAIPTDYEFIKSHGEEDDPLAEDKYRPVPNIIHRYPTKALLLATDFCALRCRYCTRSRFVSEDMNRTFSDICLSEALDYIRKTPQITDVLISGGDPLTLSDEKIDWLLSNLNAIPHVEFVRMGTKTPVVLPQRFTPRLIGVLKKYRPLWLSIHVMHPNELSEDTLKVFAKLADAGIPLGSQTVLLKDVNDNSDVLRTMFMKLIKNRVRPYYLYQCDPIMGSSHFRTPIEKGLEIMRDLLGRTTGYAIPQFVVDTSGGGKVPLLPNYTLASTDSTVDLMGFNGQVTKYPKNK